MKLNFPGVYLLRNLKNGKQYVGSSINVRRRKSEHLLRLRKGEEGNEYLQRAWNKHGPEMFSFFLLERCEIEERLEREQYWIDKLKTTDEQYGYNLIPTRKSQLYGEALSIHQKRGWAKHSPEERKKLNLHLNKPEAKMIALALSNEAKKLPAWRNNMRKNAWDKLQRRWDDPIEAAKIIAAQNAGKARARARKLLESGKTNEEIVRPTAK